MTAGQVLRRGRLLRSLSAVGGLMLSATLLAACDWATLRDSETRSPDVMDRVRSLDLSPRFPKSTESSGTPSDQRRPVVVEAGRVPAEPTEVLAQQAGATAS